MTLQVGHCIATATVAVPSMILDLVLALVVTTLADSHGCTHLVRLWQGVPLRALPLVMSGSVYTWKLHDRSIDGLTECNVQLGEELGTRVWMLGCMYVSMSAHTRYRYPSPFASYLSRSALSIVCTCD